MTQKGIVNNLVNSFATKIAVASLNFIILIVSARYLGVESRGEISIFLLNIAIMQIINEIFTGYSLIYFIPRFNIKRIFRSGVIATLVCCSACSFLFVLLNKQVPGYEFSGWLVAVIVVTHTFNCVILLGKEKVKQYNFLSLLQPLILTVVLCICLFVFHIFTFKAYFYSLLCSFSVVAAISLFLVTGILRTSENKTHFNLMPILINGFYLQSATLMYVFANRYSFYLLPDTARVGLYASASSLMEAVLLIANSIAPVLAARVANHENKSENAYLTLALIKLSFFSSLLVIGFIALIPEQLMIWVLGKGFTGIRALMMLYSPAVLMAGIFIPLSSYFASSGKQKKLLPCYAAGFLLTLILAPVMITLYDVRGAAYTAIFSYAVICIGILFMFIREQHLKLQHFFLSANDFMLFRKLLSRKGETISKIR